MKRILLKGLLLASCLLTSSNILTVPARAATRITNFPAGTNYDMPFSVASRGYYTIDVSSHFGGDADLYLFDENNALVARSIIAGSDNLEGYMNPGNYTIRVRMSFCMFDYCTANINVRRGGRIVPLDLNLNQ